MVIPPFVLSWFTPRNIVRLAAVIAVVVFFWWLGAKIHRHGADEVRAEWAIERAAQSQALAAAQARVREVEGQLVIQTQAIREETNVQIAALATQRDSLLERLRNYRAATTGGLPQASSNPANPEAPAIGNGPVVLATIGEQDVDEAHRADVIRLELLACYAQYERVAAEVNSMSNEE